MKKIQVDIVLPCYNPVPGWTNSVIHYLHKLEEQIPLVEFHCTIVNDGSSSGISADDVSALGNAIPGLHWIEYAPNRGKGYALRRGIQEANSDIVLYTDVDFPYDTSSIANVLIPVIEDRCDVALAVRNASYYGRLPATRRWISKILRGMNKRLLAIPTADTQGGLKAFNTKAKTVFLATTIDRYLFDLEFIAKCAADSSIRILPVESTLRDDVQFSSVRFGILARESLNFGSLLWNRWLG